MIEKIQEWIQHLVELNAKHNGELGDFVKFLAFWGGIGIFFCVIFPRLVDIIDDTIKKTKIYKKINEIRELASDKKRLKENNERLKANNSKLFKEVEELKKELQERISSSAKEWRENIRTSNENERRGVELKRLNEILDVENRYKGEAIWVHAARGVEVRGFLEEYERAKVEYETELRAAKGDPKKIELIEQSYKDILDDLKRQAAWRR